MSNLLGSIRDGLEDKRKRLAEVEQETKDIIAFSENLESQAAQLELMDTSAREAKNNRDREKSGRTIQEQIKYNREKLKDLGTEQKALQSAIALISQQ